MRRILSLCVLALIAAACGPKHIGTYVPKQREYDLPTDVEVSAEAGTPGSLWRENWW